MGRLESKITEKSRRKASASRRGSKGRSFRRSHGDITEGATTMRNGFYHYTESGLDTVFLKNGFV